MTKLTPKFPTKLFGSADYLTAFGTALSGSPVTSSDPDVLLQNSQIGWLGATRKVVNGEVIDYYPVAAELNGVDYSFSYYLKSLYQQGIPEYVVTGTYYIGSIVRVANGTQLYLSTADNNTGNMLSNTTKWTLLGNLANLPTATPGTAAYVNTGTAVNQIPLNGTTTATETLAGTSKFATTAEVGSGTSTNTSISPFQLKTKLNTLNTVQTIGNQTIYITKDHSGNIVRQQIDILYTTNIAPNGSAIITYAVPFNTAVSSIQMSIQSSTPDNGVITPQLFIAALSQFTIYNRDGDSTINVCRITAVGY